MTNGDKIRKMSDEEMLEFFFGPEAYLIYMPVEEKQMINGVQVIRTSTIRLLDWMKMECEN